MTAKNEAECLTLGTGGIQKYIESNKQDDAGKAKDSQLPNSTT
jgi:hypothetical protein